MTARYEVEAVVGRGAMGVVYRARQIGTGRLVAYKRVSAADPELIARLQREAEALARLDHPHIVGILDVVEDGDGMAIVMQYAGGPTLADVLARRGSLPAEPAARLLAAIADALASAHRSGVLHRDVKPANILFTAEGHPLLSDFGVAQVTTSAPLTAAGAIGPATGEYLDPVVADGGAFDERSDCYALGVVAYELLTGQRPYRGETPLAVLRAADAARCTPLGDLSPDTPPALVAVVESAMARDPALRPAGAAELAAALRAAVGAGAPPHLRLDSVSFDPAAPAAMAAPPEEPFSQQDRAPADRLLADPPTRRFGPRPPAPPAVPADSAVPWRRIAAAAALAVVMPLGAVLGVQQLRTPPVPPAVEQAAPAPAAPVPVKPATPVSLPLCDGVDIPSGGGVLTGDLEGLGCRSWVRYDGQVLEAALSGATVRVSVGQPGDVLLLGDWDCNASQTAALYRPATGEVFLFNSWADGEQPLTSEPALRTGVANGDPQVQMTGDCAAVVVRPAAGAGA